MKFNFRKVASIIASTVMIGSSIALGAAASFPSPFVQNGAGNVAVVYSSNPTYASVDMAAVLEITGKLSSQITSSAISSTAVSTAGGDAIKLERSSSKLHAGQGVTDVFSRAITSDDLPALLADGVYTDANSGDHDYTQKVNVENLSLTQFADSSYKDSLPTIGVMISNGAPILNYTLQMSDQPDFGTALKNTDISMMGKNYFIVDQTNYTSTMSLTLLDSATTYSVNEGETRTVTVGSSSYDITVGDVTSDNKVRITVGGKTSSALAIGATYKVTNGVYIGVKDVIYKSKETATSKAELAVGAGKLVLTDGSSVELNENTVNGLTAHIYNSTTKLDKVVLQWTADDKMFITKDSSITMPGFGALKLSFGGLIVPQEETIKVVNDGRQAIQLQLPIKDGDVSLDILRANQTSGKFQNPGRDFDKVLRTNATNKLLFDADTDEYFVASWSDGKDFESYVLYASGFTTDNNANQTSVYNKVSGNKVKDVKSSQGDHVTIGNVDLEVGQVDRTGKTIALVGGSGVSFNTLYSKAGMKIQLPYTAATWGLDGSFVIAANSTVNLRLLEADKNGNIGSGGNVTLTLGLTSLDNYTKVTVASLSAPASLQDAEIANTNVYQSTVYSDLATVVTSDRGPDQNTVNLVYHGGESYGQVVLSAPSAVIGGETGGLSIKDSEVATLGAGKNLIVVGGSCVNTYTAQLLGVSFPTCAADWTAATTVGAGEFLIKTYPIADGKIATLVAGYEAQDTLNAAKALTSNTNVVIAAGTGQKGTSATSLESGLV